MRKTWDVVVLGLGAAGSAAALHLARRGRRVLGLEQFSPAHDRGSSHGKTRIIRQAYFEHPDYVPLLLRAYELWHELERATGSRLLLRTGGLMAGAPSSTVVSGSIESARRHGLPHRVLEGDELRRAFPKLRFRPGEVALFEEGAGVLLPEECLRAQQRLAVESGAELRFGVRARVEPRSDGPVELELASGERVRAERVVVTAGAWLPKLLPDAVPTALVERVWVAWWEPRADREAFSHERFPVFIWDEGKDTFYGLPETRGEGVKVAFHHSHEAQDPDAPRRPVSEAEVARLRARIAERLPDLDGRVLETSTCLYTTTPDEHFALGLDRSGRIVVGSACSGHGFKLSSVTGEALADLATQGTTRLPVEFLALDRPALRGTVPPGPNFG